jgi:hypothetical protein
MPHIWLLSGEERLISIAIHAADIMATAALQDSRLGASCMPGDNIHVLLSRVMRYN